MNIQIVSLVYTFMLKFEEKYDNKPVCYYVQLDFGLDAWLLTWDFRLKILLSILTL